MSTRISGAMNTLFERAQDHLTEADLKSFSVGIEDAYCSVMHLRETISGIGCLVANDNSAGNFQHAEDVPGLLFSIAESLDGIEAVIRLAQAADLELKDRQAKKAKTQKEHKP